MLSSKKRPLSQKPVHKNMKHDYMYMSFSQVYKPYTFSDPPPHEKSVQSKSFGSHAVQHLVYVCERICTISQY